MIIIWFGEYEVITWVGVILTIIPSPLPPLEGLILRLPHRTRLRCGEKWQKTEWNDIKKSESKESRAVDWGGGKGHSPQTSDFLAFSPTAKLGPRLECLKPIRESTKEANFHRKYSPNKWNNDTYGKEGDNHVYFGFSYQILLRSQLQSELSRFLTQQTEGDGFFVETSQVSVLSLLNLEFVPLFFVVVKGSLQVMLLYLHCYPTSS